MSQKKTPKKYKPKKKYQKASRKFFRLSPSYVLFSIFLIVFIFFGALVLLTSTIAPTITEPFSDETSNKQEFIERTADYAQILEEKYAILPSVSIAQAILESDWGRSELSLKNNNFFGIKGSDPEQTVVMNTKEFVDGQWIEVEAPFRKYTSWQESMDDHAKLFVEGTTWNPDQYAAVLAAKDYKEAAHALEASGYATDPDYPEKLISLIEEFNLNQYD
ncbi:glycoside hydrolase family 73 protein [Carnobacterium mobile]|uniref:glycoside hydrolase family 73 protein n=1 Tax=Carnobacterium mobile TaxID=2750 RepID=UPI00055237E7|nr:glycoside hydrolase family 73 protein [Carnobacterium mobile]